jgi:hypothetical protein
MSPSSLLLRLLLCISLVLNGSSYALASTHMQLAQVGVVPAAAPVIARQIVVEHCDEHTKAAPVGAAFAAGDDDHTPYLTQHPNCCEPGGGCKGACLQHVQAVVLSYLIGEAAIGHFASMRWMKADHETPALPHLIRPPIT